MSAVFSGDMKTPLFGHKPITPLNKVIELLFLAYFWEDFEKVKLLHETIKILKEIDGR